MDMTDQPTDLERDLQQLQSEAAEQPGVRDALEAYVALQESFDIVAQYEQITAYQPEVTTATGTGEYTLI